MTSATARTSTRRSASPVLRDSSVGEARAASRRSSVSSGRLCGAHNSAIAGGLGHRSTRLPQPAWQSARPPASAVAPPLVAPHSFAQRRLRGKAIANVGLALRRIPGLSARAASECPCDGGCRDGRSACRSAARCWMRPNAQAHRRQSAAGCEKAQVPRTRRWAVRRPCMYSSLWTVQDLDTAGALVKAQARCVGGAHADHAVVEIAPVAHGCSMRTISSAKPASG
jgi:hypothetical protein